MHGRVIVRRFAISLFLEKKIPYSCHFPSIFFKLFPSFCHIHVHKHTHTHTHTHTLSLSLSLTHTISLTLSSSLSLLHSLPPFLSLSLSHPIVIDNKVVVINQLVFQLQWEN